MDAKKMTAVEWLVNELVKKGFPIEKYAIEIYNQAKAMEKEQMKDAVLDDVLTENMKKKFAERFQQYYTETYKP